MRKGQTTHECDVLHVLWSGGVGGTERHVSSLLVEGQTHSQFAHRACLLAGSGVVGDDLAARGLAHRLGFRNGIDPLGLARLVRLVRQLRPNVVHLHTRTLASRLAIMLASPRTPVIYTEHSPGAVEGDWRAVLFYRLFGKSLARCIAIAPEMARCMNRHGVDPTRVVTIPHAFTVPTAPHGSPTGGRTPTIGTVCRLEAPKRIDVFLEVIAELRARGIACSAIVVGDGSLRERLARAARERGLAGIVAFPGLQTDVVPWLDRFDVFLVTSEVETFGIAALEAMARRVPVVAMPSAGGLSEHVGRGGLILHSREPGEAAAAVAELLASPKALADLRRRGAVAAGEHHLEDAIGALDGVYRDLITTAGPTTSTGSLTHLSPHRHARRTASGQDCPPQKADGQGLR